MDLNANNATLIPPVCCKSHASVVSIVLQILHDVNITLTLCYYYVSVMYINLTRHVHTTFMRRLHHYWLLAQRFCHICVSFVALWHHCFVVDTYMYIIMCYVATSLCVLCEVDIYQINMCCIMLSWYWQSGLSHCKGWVICSS